MNLEYIAEIVSKDLALNQMLVAFTTPTDDKPIHVSMPLPPAGTALVDHYDPYLPRTEWASRLTPRDDVEIGHKLTATAVVILPAEAEAAALALQQEQAQQAGASTAPTEIVLTPLGE